MACAVSAQPDALGMAAGEGRTITPLKPDTGTGVAVCTSITLSRAGLAAAMAALAQRGVPQRARFAASRSAAMRKLLLAALASLLPLGPAAAQRLTSTALACDEVQAIVRERGAAILYWQSQRVAGLPRYERFVRDGNFCNPADYAGPTSVPTADDPKCVVRHCTPRLDEGSGGGIIIPRN